MEDSDCALPPGEGQFPVTLTAGRHGVELAVISRQTFVQAKAIAPAEFLESLVWHLTKLQIIISCFATAYQ